VNAQRAEAAPGGVPRPRHSGFTEIANAVIDDPTLDVYERAIYEQIRRRDWHGAGWIWTYGELCAAVGCGPDTLARALRSLEERGLIMRAGPAKRPKRYFAHVPDGPVGLRPDRDRITMEPRSAAPRIPPGSGSDDGQIVIESRPDRDPSSGTYQRPSQTITDEEGSLSGEIPKPREQPTHTAPSVCDQAVETITAAIITARCSTVRCERDAGRLAGITAGVRQHIVTPLVGDPRQVTAAKVVRCIAYLRSKPHITPTMITARTVADELGPWLAAGMPERYEPPAPVQQAGPRRADLPAPLIPCEPYHAVICRCGRIQGRPHRRNICRMSGLVAANNYRDMHNPNWITTPEGEFEEYDESEQEQSAAASG
jgi:hypothetical protein